ncbi:type IX secretion system outer membrane channel protein PorV [Hymenobacter sp. BT186]|uniref:Type IX secretion system outer membrane channel protein PorV n=1 Tax=Hymenobacter telluris TaxID=2816474 RepID=A0A939EWB9_9BACT|nr:type IX secretion system outer membrane channel protein PorV [Hymenobacter telluris]MBO0357772.1 type IX secretion system outer membrane channel protein PorV [Hymenobacter telluris]MBW3373799.1 type IX secretion system outer membrane channel protein PorV [Hymenobacter norwichensis]
MTFSKLPVRSALLSGLLGLPLLGAAQSSPNTITTAVPILTISPDSRSAALGEAGVAISPDANSAYYNAGKLGFVPNKYSFSPSYTPWLASITDDMGLAYLSGYAKTGSRSAISASLMYFNLGEIQFRDFQNVAGPTFSPKEYAFTVAYGQKLTDNFGVGVAARYIRSNLTDGGSTDFKPGNAAAVDLGAYYNKDLSLGAADYNLALGASITNIGNKITYTNPRQADFLPTTLKLGTAITRELDAYNKLTFTVDFAKLLVPSPYYIEGDTTFLKKSINANNEARRRKGVVAAALGSFSDAPGGFREELREVNISAGAEYTYNDLLMARVGYFYENPVKGDRNYLSFGLGVRYQVFGVDGAYLVPNSKANPLAQTIRVSLHFNFNKLDEAFGDGTETPVN